MKHSKSKKLSLQDLLQSGLIDRSELARQLWPDNPDAHRLDRQIDPEDEKRIRLILKPVIGRNWREL